MTYANRNAGTTAPLWAVFGAPLVGVPLMVGLLALGSGPAGGAVVETDVGFTTEQVDAPELDVADEVRWLHSD